MRQVSSSGSHHPQLPAIAVSAKHHTMRLATCKGAGVDKVLFSEDGAGWSPTKDIVHEYRISKAWSESFSGAFMKCMASSQIGFALTSSRPGLSTNWPQHKGGWQGQDGKFSSLHHEIQSVVGIAGVWRP